MKTSHLHRALVSNPHTYAIYGGIFPRDRLPLYLRNRRPLGIIANTHRAHQPGQHWVAFYFDRQGYATYFDSYGLPPKPREFRRFLNNNASSYVFNTKRIQGNDTTCGMYCLYFLYSMSRDQGRMLRHLPNRRLYINDRWIRQWVKNSFNINFH